MFEHIGRWVFVAVLGLVIAIMLRVIFHMAGFPVGELGRQYWYGCINGATILILVRGFIK